MDEGAKGHRPRAAAKKGFTRLKAYRFAPDA